MWEDGKRIEWFSEDQIQSINSKKLDAFDYTMYFVHTDSKDMVEAGAIFARPPGFDYRISEIKKKMA